jgi:hypothetical protein
VDKGKERRVSRKRRGKNEEKKRNKELRKEKKKKKKNHPFLHPVRLSYKTVLFQPMNSVILLQQISKQYFQP